MTRRPRGDPRKVIREISLALLGLLAAGCAATDVREGQSGPVRWEIIDKTRTTDGWSCTIALRETAGVGIQFVALQTIVPLPPPAGRREWHGGIGETAFIRRLEPRSEVRTTFASPYTSETPAYADLEFRGTDDVGRDVRVRLRVYMR